MCARTALHVCERKERAGGGVRGEAEEGRGVHARIHRTAPRHKDNVLSESVFLCVRPFQRSAPLFLHKPLSSSPARALCERELARLSSRPLCRTFMARYISASKLRWRKYGDSGGASRSLRHKGGRTVRGRFMEQAAHARSIMPAALLLHYGNTEPTHRPQPIHHTYCHTGGKVCE